MSKSDLPSVTSGVKQHFERWAIPILIVVFCLAAFWMSTTFKKMPPILKRGIQPSDFPQLLLVALVLLTCAMAWFDPVRVREKMENAVWVSIALMLVFAAVAQVDLFLGLGVFAALLAFSWGERNPIALSFVGLVLPTAIFFLFDLVFEIRFPRGALTNLWYG